MSLLCQLQGFCRLKKTGKLSLLLYPWFSAFLLVSQVFSPTLFYYSHIPARDSVRPGQSYLLLFLSALDSLLLATNTFALTISWGSHVGKLFTVAPNIHGPLVWLVLREAAVALIGARRQDGLIAHHLLHFVVLRV